MVTRSKVYEITNVNTHDMHDEENYIIADQVESTQTTIPESAGTVFNVYLKEIED